MVIFILLFLMIICWFLDEPDIREEKVTVNATVTDKTYQGSSVIPIRVGNMSSLLHQPERYFVTIDYEGYTETFNDAIIYENIEIGDTVEMVLHQYYDENNTIIRQHFE